MPELTVASTTQWVKGQSGNPLGRPPHIEGHLPGYKKRRVCMDCGDVKIVRADNTATLCRACAQKGTRSPTYKHGRSGTKEYGTEWMRQYRVKWIAAGRHPELKEKGAGYRLKRFEKLAGRPCGEICEACGKHCPKNYVPGNGNSRRLVYDHSHKTGRFRGWICQGCNKALGSANDSIETLQKLIEYLRKEVQ